MSNFRVGVIGGGQLARMMAPPASQLGINMRVLVEQLNGSAEQVFKDTVVGDITLDNLRRIVYGLDGIDLQKTDVLTFEHEFVPNELIAKIENEGFNVQPSSKALIYAQNKIFMREKVAQIITNIKTITKYADFADTLSNPKFAVIEKMVDLERFIVGNQLKECVIKTPTGGYDGKGVYFVNTNDLSEIETIIKQGQTLLAEEKLDFEFELSCLVARSSNECKVYPITQTISENGVCRTTITPAPNLTKSEQKIARNIGKLIADEIGVQGIMAIEMFYKSGYFYINEFAMRPHNTGHWTQNGAVTSQFENHLRGVLDLPLGEVSQTEPQTGQPLEPQHYTVMQNILGSQLSNLTDALPAVLALDSRIKVHLYGKEIRNGRKLGHLNISGEDYVKLNLIAKRASDLFEGNCN